MNYQQLQKLPKVINSRLGKQMAQKPWRLPNKDKRQNNIDIISIYEKQRKSTAYKQIDHAMSIEERGRYIKETKKNLGIDERELALSSKRSTHGDSLRYDYPHLEFNQYFKLQHGEALYQPHEMKWSLDEVAERVVDMKNDQDERAMKFIQKKYDDMKKALDRFEQEIEQKEISKKHESLKKQLDKVAADIQEKDKI